MSVDRWMKAQAAEADHEAHSDGVTPPSHAERYFSDYWNTDVDSLTGKDVLAVGSGTGIVHTLDGPGRRVGIDPLNDTIQAELSGSKASLVTGVGEALPFPDGEFEAVVSFNVLDHCLAPAETLREIRRVLTADGNLYLALNTFDLPAFVRNRIHVVDTPHPHHFRASEVESLLQDVGFSITHFDSTPRYRSRWPLLREREFKQFVGSFSRIRWTVAVATPD